MRWRERKRRRRRRRICVWQAKPHLESIIITLCCCFVNQYGTSCNGSLRCHILYLEQWSSVVCVFACAMEVSGGIISRLLQCGLCKWIRFVSTIIYLQVAGFFRFESGSSVAHDGTEERGESSACIYNGGWSIWEYRWHGARKNCTVLFSFKSTSSQGARLPPPLPFLPYRSRRSESQTRRITIICRYKAFSGIFDWSRKKSGAFHVSLHRFNACENELQINWLTSGQT